MIMRSMTHKTFLDLFIYLERFSYSVQITKQFIIRNLLTKGDNTIQQMRAGGGGVGSSELNTV